MATDAEVAVLAAAVNVFRVLDRLQVPYQGEGTQQITCPNPTHVDRHPSARLYAETHSIHCWTCQRSWDVIGIVRVRLGLSLDGAVDWLRDQGLAGVPLAPLPAPVALGPLVAHVEAALIAARDRLGRARYVRYLLALDLVTYQAQQGTIPPAQAALTLATLYRHAVDADRL